MIQFLEMGIRLRFNPLVNAEDEDLYVVSLFPRENWTKVLSKSADFGYLQFDRRKAGLVFEGDKERWTIPISALTAVRVEEATVGEGGPRPLRSATMWSSARTVTASIGKSASFVLAQNGATTTPKLAAPEWVSCSTNSAQPSR